MEATLIPTTPIIFAPKEFIRCLRLKTEPPPPPLNYTGWSQRICPVSCGYWQSQRKNVPTGRHKVAWLNTHNWPVQSYWHNTKSCSVKTQAEKDQMTVEVTQVLILNAMGRLWKLWNQVIRWWWSDLCFKITAAAVWDEWTYRIGFTWRPVSETSKILGQGADGRGTSR